MQFGGLKLKRCRHGWMLFSGPYIRDVLRPVRRVQRGRGRDDAAVPAAGDTAVDVGANIGDLTVPLAGVVGDAGRVYAVESNPDMFNVLCANLALNGITNTRPVNAFVAPASGADTAGPWEKYANTGDRWEPRFLALDELALPACHLIKVDVDGKEAEVLRSGQGLIERTRPVLYFEKDQRAASQALLAYVLGLGYDLYWHPAPIVSPQNFFGNPVNHWAPRTIVSLMVVGVPGERHTPLPDLARVTGPDSWWVL